MKRRFQIAGAVILGLFCAVHPALADHVTFDLETLGTLYGTPVGDVPGDYLFAEGGADLYIAEFYVSGNPYFNFSQIDPEFAGPSLFFGSLQILEVNNVTIVFDFSAPGVVTFEYLDLGGSVNLLVNGAGPVLEGPDMASLAGIVAPGVTMSVVANPVPGGHRGTVTLSGPVQRLRVGGQEFWLDDVKCDNGQPGGDCDLGVTHESLAVGDIWGAGYGQAPGDYIFDEDGIPVFIEELDWGSGTGFNHCQVMVPMIPGFGANLVMGINNVCNRYEIGTLGLVTAAVKFEYADLGGMENLQVNGATLFIGELNSMPPNVAPGVTMSVTTVGVPGGLRGEVTLLGDVHQLWVGGQEFFIDNICVVAEGPAPECDLVSDNESLSPGDAWGGALGQSPGDLVFSEDSIAAHVVEFDYGSGTGFYTASIGPPWGPIGDGNALHLNNISMLYTVNHPAPVVGAVFEFCTGGGIENLGIDGNLFVGDIETLPAGFFGGLNVVVNATAGPGYIYGTVEVHGGFERLLIGGQEFYCDNLCIFLDDISSVPVAARAGARLSPGYPNPFNPSTTLRFKLDRDQVVELSIVDPTGKRVATLVDGLRSAGDGQVVWDGRDTQGRVVAAGVYFALLRGENSHSSQKIVLVK